MSQRKIVNEDEARRLLMDEGWTYQQMIDLYREKYGVETSASVWSRFLKGAGKARIVRTYPLAAPWLVRAKNPRNGHYRTGLRALAAIEHGEDVAERIVASLFVCVVRLAWAGLLIMTGMRMLMCLFLVARGLISGGFVTRLWMTMASLWLICRA